MTAIAWKKLQNGSDIRGVALEGVPDEPVNLTPEVVARIGQGFVTWLSEQQGKGCDQLAIAVGRDSRLSGPDLMSHITTAIASLGATVYDVGLASTPAMFTSTIAAPLTCDGAIMLTASHLPFNRNGCKFFTAQGGLNKPDITAILTLAEANAFTPAPTPGPIHPTDFMSHYAAQLVEMIRQGVNHPDHYDRPLQGLNIIVDAGNGAGGFYVSHVLQPLGADTTGSQFLDPDGTFPNHIPNPEDETAMAAICAAVTGNQADFGIIFDTDVDRGAAVDATGRELNRNLLIALIAAITLREHPGSTVVTDSITSDGLTRFIEQDLVGTHHRFKRGYKNVINEAMRLNETGEESWLAIETSGHGAMRENHWLDDGAYLVSKVLVELARAKLADRPVTDLIATLQEPAESQEFRLKIHADDFKAYGNEVIAALTAHAEAEPDWAIAPQNHEGVRVTCTAPTESGWFLLRLSLHDPVIPLNVETNVTGGVAKIQARLLDFLQQFDALDLTPLQS
ncbi:phosphomannomutase/phosphoglucomutase [Spirulina major CS-329]|uniref:phosphomannomutase/phosphoglucomutase n=1 Tax=Spirulina TaxID=1154 RepID=UPI00232DB513|nr:MULTISPECIES: phosphomannomutase/phosphoglucomutase [Spirulina]MDB9493359.1 phosphomannomutase/phosphoglucomutase [Spirulina subsalsa CS-330]MDB9502811.1 phosphomannomutase/phosphoglucomutase [Spirulina major CS-329]